MTAWASRVLEQECISVQRWTGCGLREHCTLEGNPRQDGVGETVRSAGATVLTDSDRRSCPWLLLPSVRDGSGIRAGVHQRRMPEYGMGGKKVDHMSSML